MNKPQEELNTSRARVATLTPNEGINKQQQTKKRKKRDPRSSPTKRFGDDGFNLDDAELFEEASWLEVCTSCFIHSPREWLKIFVGLVLVVACFYYFGVGLEFLSSGAKVLTGCSTGTLFGRVANPLTALMTGLLATVLLQSSSTTTSIIVGLVGADSITVQHGIYMVMGANIGTCVTNSIVSLGHFNNPDQLEPAFSGATVHSMFNMMTVAILFPIECATGYLYYLTSALVRGADTQAGTEWNGPVKRFIYPLTELVLIANNELIDGVANGDSCSSYYPINCTDPEHPAYKTCSRVGLIACNKQSGKCPAFFSADSGIVEDQISGLVVFLIGLFCIFTSLFALVFVLKKLLMGVSVRVIYKATNINGYFLIALGCGVTMLLQSSSTTTSFLTPIAGMGALRLEQVFAITVGANLGTPITALLAALVLEGNQGLQVALSHVMFNITGMLIWYPIPYMRTVPMGGARRLGQLARLWRGFSLIWLFSAFLIVPSMFLGLSTLFTENIQALTVVGSLLSALLFFLLAFFIRWCYFKGGRDKVFANLTLKQQRYLAKGSIGRDMYKCKLQVARLQAFAGFIPETSIMPASSSSNVRGDSPPSTNAQLREALNNLPHDMIYIKDCLDALFRHTGLSSQYNNADVEGGGNISESLHLRPMEDESPTTGSSFWQQIPRYYFLSFLIAFPIFLWGIVTLYQHDSKASVGAASFLLILLALSVIWTAYWWKFENGKQWWLNHFEEISKGKGALKSLPEDMAQLKRDIKELFVHFKIPMPDVKIQNNPIKNTTNPDI